MADYRLKLYRRLQRHTTPGALVGAFSVEAEDSAAAISRLAADHADAIAGCDFAFIAGPHGRIVWEYGGSRDSDP
jgi:hypothetical protein